MSVPIPGIRDVIDGMSYFLSWLNKRKRQKLFSAWENRQLNDIYRIIIDYYGDYYDQLFSYPQSYGTRIKVPLYVAPGWDSLSRSKLKMRFKEETRPFNPANSQKAFWEFYRELKKRESGESDWPLYDAPIFRLIKIEDSNGGINLSFELGKFSESVMCQYILEHELVTCHAGGSISPGTDLKLRNSVAANPQMFNSFFQKNVCRIGICNLILLKVNKEEYVPMVQPRGELSMVGESLLDAVSSCIFEVATEPNADFELQHTVLREIYEELFGNPDVATRSRKLDPKFFYKKDGISDLRALIKDGSAIFEITGFCIDLVRIVPEITTLLVVQDESYYQRHYSPLDSSVAPFCLNPEFERTSLFSIPANLDEVDTYLTSAYSSKSNSNFRICPFKPMRWTLPGGFSFYQGLKRAKSKGLL